MSTRLIVKNSIILYVRLIVTTILGIFTSRFILSALGVSDYGLYNVVGGIVAMMAFINTVMVSTTYRYIAYEIGKPQGNINKIFNISLSIHIVISIIVIILALSIGIWYIYNHLNVDSSRINTAVFVFCFSIVNTICVVLATPFQGFLIAKEKFAITVPIELTTKLFHLVLVIMLNYVTGDRLKIYAVFITLVHLLNPIMYVGYCFRNYYQDVKWKIQSDLKVFAEMIKFSGWIMIGAAASVGENQGSALIINRFFGTVLNASFGVASQLGSMVKMFANSLNQAVVPQITKTYSSGDISTSSRLVMMTSKYSFFLLLIPALPILLETDFILENWLATVPPHTVIFVKIMLFNELVKSTMSGFSAFIQASGMIKWFQIISSSVILIGLPVAYSVFLLGYPPYFISYVYTATAVLSSLTTLVMMRKIFKFDVILFLKKSLFKMAIVGMFILPLALIKHVINSGVLRFVFTLVGSELWLFIVIYCIGMEKNEKTTINKYIVDFIEGTRFFSKTSH